MFELIFNEEAGFYVECRLSFILDKTQHLQVTSISMTLKIHRLGNIADNISMTRLRD